MGKLIDLTGQRFGRLIVVNLAGRDNFRQAVWNCVCDCGNTTQVRSNNLRNGSTTSCGCFHRKRAKETHEIHGFRYTRLFSIWCGMKQRCYNPKYHNYPRYGGRGIVICEAWKNDFISFQEWAIANGYSDELTIDRIDVNGNYEPSNCRWATQKTQCNNKRNNRFIEYNGETHTLQEWAQKIGICHTTLIERIKRWGSIEEALTIPKGGKQRWG
ncbi:MAG: hypothetical protein IJN75_04165 [Clostridia bacterium]|nr:hypothetical protein [Clostridia bacterium]